MDEEEENPVTSWSTIWVTTIVSIVQGLIFYAFYLRTRRKDSEKQSVDLYEPRQHNRKHRSPPPFEESWWKSAYNVSQEELLRCVGLDSFMFLRFLRMGARVCLVGTLLALVLVPVYATGNNEGTTTLQFNQITLARVVADSDRLWASVLAWFIFVAFVLYSFWTEWKLYFQNRFAFLAKGDEDMHHDYRYAVRVEQIPTEYRTDQALYKYFDRLFPNQVQQATVFLNTSKLQALMEERQETIENLEKAVAFTHAKPDKPKPTTKKGAKAGCIGGQKVDAIEFYESEIVRLNNEIDQERSTFVNPDKLPSDDSDETAEKGEGNLEVSISGTLSNADGNKTSKNSPKVTSTAFVTFTTLRAKQAAIQCELTGNPDSMVVIPAPDPKGVLWKNVGVPLPQQKAFKLQATLFFMVGLLFWAVPVSFVTAIARLNGILKAFGLPTANPEAGWYGLVSGLLPVIFLAILMAVLYMLIVAAATNLIRYKSAAEVDAYTLHWHQLFQFANLWLILIGGSAFDQIDTLIDDPTKIIEILAETMPSASTFFVNMMIVGSFGAFGMELSLLPTYGVKLIMQLIQPEAMLTQRQLDEAKTPPSLVWGKLVPKVVFIFLVVVIYMPIVPLMEVFGLVYFSGHYLVYKHQCLHVYAQEFEGGGEATWQRVFPFLMACLYMGELVFIVYMGLKEAPIQGGLGFIPLIVTLFFHMHLKRTIVQPLRNLSLEVAANVDIDDGELDRTSASVLYGMPALNTAEEERGPMPYRRDPAAKADVEEGAPMEEVVEEGGNRFM